MPFFGLRSAQKISEKNDLKVANMFLDQIRAAEFIFQVKNSVGRLYDDARGPVDPKFGLGKVPIRLFEGF